MRKHNDENELIKRDYVAWLRGPKGRNQATLDAVMAAIHGFEAFTRFANFKTFRREQAISYRERLAGQTNGATGKPLSLSTLHSRLSALRAFFEWLSREPGYRKTVRFNDAAYFNLSANEARTATAKREQPTPSLEQIAHVLETMPADTIIQRRDRAVVAFVILTGARDSAVASLRRKHVDLETGRVTQDAREVKTKAAKTFTSVFFPVGERPLQIVTDWIAELDGEQLFGPDDPLFPASERGLDELGLFTATKLSRQSWTSAQPIRAIFRRAFETAGLPYFRPHSFRHTLMQLAYRLKLDLREGKAWSQNLAHDGILVSLVSYGEMSVDQQAEIVAGLARRGAAPAGGGGDVIGELEALVSRLKGA